MLLAPCGRSATATLAALLAFCGVLAADAAVASPNANNVAPAGLFDSRFRNNLTNAVAVMTGRTVQIPCGVTSPDTRVSLYRVNGGGANRAEHTKLRLERPDDGTASAAEEPPQFGLRGMRYAPSAGFTANVASLAARGLYVCRAERGATWEERRFFLNVVDDSPHAILQPWLMSLFGYSFARGSTLAITCSVNVRRGNPITIAWSKDGASIDAENDPRIVISPIKYSPPCMDCTDGRLLHGYVEAASTLTIASVQPTDSGDYECGATSFGQRRAARQLVLVSDFAWDGEIIDSLDTARRE